MGAAVCVGLVACAAPTLPSDEARDVGVKSVVVSQTYEGIVIPGSDTALLTDREWAVVVDLHTDDARWVSREIEAVLWLREGPDAEPEPMAQRVLIDADPESDVDARVRWFLPGERAREGLEIRVDLRELDTSPPPEPDSAVPQLECCTAWSEPGFDPAPSDIVVEMFPALYDAPDPMSTMGEWCTHLEGPSEGELVQLENRLLATLPVRGVEVRLRDDLSDEGRDWTEARLNERLAEIRAADGSPRNTFYFGTYVGCDADCCPYDECFPGVANVGTLHLPAAESLVSMAIACVPSSLGLSQPTWKDMHEALAGD
jgi:hypothetical protein